MVIFSCHILQNQLKREWEKVQQLWKNLPLNEEPVPLLPYDTWRVLSEGFPDEQIRQQVLEGIKNRFDANWHGDYDKLPTKSKNPNITLQEKIDMTRQLIDLHTRHILIGPYTKDDNPLQISPSPIWPISKFFSDGTLQKLRIVHDMSNSGNGLASVNEYFTKDQRELEMETLQVCAGIALLVGKEGFMWVVDQMDAFYSVRYQKKDWRLIGFQWLNKLLCFNVSSFGIAIGPQLYNKQSLILKYIINKRSKGAFDTNNAPNNLPIIKFDSFMGPLEIYFINIYKKENKPLPHIILKRIEQFNKLSNKCHIKKLIMSYVDEFIGGHWKLATARKQFEVTKSSMFKLGLDPKVKKCEAPARGISPLGSNISLPQQRISLQVKKATQYTQVWKDCINKSITKRKSLSLEGKATYASIFYPPLKARPRIQSYRFKDVKLDHHRKITGFFANNANIIANNFKYAISGLSLYDFYLPYGQSDLHIYTDAASTIGAGAHNTKDGSYFFFSWEEIPPIDCDMDIQFKELFAAAVMIIMVAKSVKNTRINVHGDNIPIAYIAEKRICKYHRIDLLALIIIINDIAILHNLILWYSALPSKWNPIADGLSRFDKTLLENAPFPLTKQLNPTQIANNLAKAVNSFIKNIKTGQGSAEFIHRFSLVQSISPSCQH